ncbi:MAG TPA: sulfurtransferase TusA family protein [Bacillales bacterium]|nr:sulfurtransferase TusA family protein [Bacillales bacterium]
MQVDQTVDARGMACPIPLVKKEATDQLDSGQVLEIRATDKGAKNDLATWTQSGGHELLEQTEEDDVLKFKVKKG